MFRLRETQRKRVQGGLPPCRSPCCVRVLRGLATADAHAGFALRSACVSSWESSVPHSGTPKFALTAKRRHRASAPANLLLPGRWWADSHSTLPYTRSVAVSSWESKRTGLRKFEVLSVVASQCLLAQMARENAKYLCRESRVRNCGRETALARDSGDP